MLKQFAGWVILGAVAILAGCGSNVTFAPPPAGNFSKADLNGSYAFAFTGLNNAGFASFAGSLQADGNGNITAGIQDVNSGNGIFTSVAITGSYTVNADGRGTATLLSALNPVNIDFVLISSRHALIIRFDTFATGSGTMDLQDSTAFSNGAIQGGFAMNLSGINSVGNTFATAGEFSADSSGNITAGAADFNNNGVISANLPLSGSLIVSGPDGRGTATLTTTLAALSFSFYIVDANHLKLLQIDATSGTVLAGDAYRQGAFSTTLTGSFAFTVGGSSNGPYVAGGIFNVDTSGNVTGGARDINQNGNIAQTTNLSGSYTIAATGRGTMTLNDSAGSTHFVIYPSTGGLQMLEVDSTIVSSGSALARQSTSFSNSSLNGGYAFNMTGVSAGSTVDAIAQFTADGNGHFTGTVDFNNTGNLALGVALGGTYSANSNGRATATFNSSGGSFTMAFYIVDSTTVLLVDLNTNFVGVGAFNQQ